MKLIKMGLVSALMLAMSAGSAIAGGDIYGDYRGSIKDEVYADSGHRWYLRGDIGYGYNSDPEIIDEVAAYFVGEDLDDTWSIGGGIGYYLTRGFRMDVTLDYRFDSDLYAYYPASPALPLTGELSSLVGLVNFYYELDMGHRITPYVGVGIGFARHEMDAGKQINGVDPVDFDGDSETEFAWALMAGVDIDLREGWKLDVGYRYLDMGSVKYTDATTGTKVYDIDDLESHEFRVGLRYSFSCWRSCEPSYEPMK